jgi:RNA polymerase sigma factor (sigma-70 family)
VRHAKAIDRTQLAVGNGQGSSRKRWGTSLLQRAANPVQRASSINGQVAVADRAPIAAAAGSALAMAASLVEQARSGDNQAFDKLVEQRLERTYRTALAILGNEADARDATQETFVHAWRELPRLRASDHFDSWLRTILVNNCRKALRGRRRRLVREIAVGDPVEQLGEVASGEAAPDEQVATTEVLEHAFERLSVDERELLVLHHLERRPLTEIAATLGVPLGTAKSRLFAARGQLERALEVELR